ncbi:MAG: hypothetical protein ABA06_02970 [Parcubacteria bacterium C7867-001]|nr:MAG: hypothetical protein ABA06_02970 [Parcubacteria bacterium C7867-001]
MRFIVSLATLFLVGIVARHAWLVASGAPLDGALSTQFTYAAFGAITIELAYWAWGVVTKQKFGAMHSIDGFFSVILVGCAVAALARYAGHPLFEMTPIMQGVATTGLAMVLGLKVVTAVLRAFGSLALASAPIDQRLDTVAEV